MTTVVIQPSSPIREELKFSDLKIGQWFIEAGSYDLYCKTEADTFGYFDQYGCMAFSGATDDDSVEVKALVEEVRITYSVRGRRA